MLLNVQKWLPRKLRIAGAVILAVLLVLQVVIALVATPVARRSIAASLTPASKLQRLYLNLFGGSITVRGLEISQPSGFGDTVFLSIGKARLDLGLSWLLVGKIRVSSLDATDVAVSVIKDTNGVMNVATLATPSEEPTVEEKPVVEEESAGGGLPIHIGRIRIAGLNITYQDRSKSDTKPVDINVRDGVLDISNMAVMANTASINKLISRITLHGQLTYRDTPAAFIGLSARTGPLGSGAPAVAARLVVSGFELDSAGSLIPPGVAATLAGDVIDVHATLMMATNLLDLNATVETAGATFPIIIAGTPGEPKIKSGDVLLGAFGRLGSLVGNTATDVAAASLAVGQGAVNVASTVGHGAASIAGGVGKGLLNVAKSAATLDVKAMGTNLTSTVANTGKTALHTVTDAGGTAISTVGEAGKATAGTERSASWRTAKHDRFVTRWDEAQDWVNAANYPTLATP